jgi:hypothetical protein
MCIRRSLTYNEQCPSCKHASLASQLAPVRRLDALTDILHNVRALVDAVVANANAVNSAASPARTRGKRKDAKLAIDVRKRSKVDVEDEEYRDEDFVDSVAVANGDDDGEDDELLMASPRALRSQRRGASALNSPSSSQHQHQQQHQQQQQQQQSSVKTQLQSPKKAIPLAELGFDDATKRFPCPVCGASVELQFINQHLDVCTSGPATPPRAKAAKAAASSASATKPTSAPVQSSSSPRVPHGLHAVTDWQTPVADRNSLPRNPHFKTLSLPALKSRLNALGLSTMGRRDMMEARHREFVLLCHSNADLPTPLSLAEIAAQVNAIDFSTTTSVALTRSSSGVDDETTVEFAVGRRARSSSAPTLNNNKVEPVASMTAAGEPPTLLQRAVKLAAGVDFGEWRVVWSTKFQRPFYFNARNGIGVFDKPVEVPVDVYALAVEQHRAANDGADAPPPANDDDYSQ